MTKYNVHYCKKGGGKEEEKMVRWVGVSLYQRLSKDFEKKCLNSCIYINVIIKGGVVWQ